MISHQASASPWSSRPFTSAERPERMSPTNRGPFTGSPATKMLPAGTSTKEQCTYAPGAPVTSECTFVAAAATSALCSSVASP